MRIEHFPAAELTPELLSAWSRLQQADRSLESPYFRPEFTQAVAAVRGDVEVAVLEEGGEPVGFFPFQRAHGGMGRPVGGRMSDFQGVIVQKGVEWNAEELIRGCGLTAWDFDHLLVSQQAFAPHHATVKQSPFMDLSDGFEAFYGERRKAGSVSIKKFMQKGRRLARDVGPLRLERRECDEQVFETLVRWKSEQYRRTKVTNVVSFEWTVALLRQIIRQQSEAFSGMLLALYAGDQLAAIDLAMRSHHALHSWFCAYNRDLARYSPGQVHLVETAKAAEQLGIRRIHLGSGPEQYKWSFASDSVTVAEGAVECRPVRGILRRGVRNTREWIRRSPLERPARVPIAMIRDVRNWLAFR